MAEPDLIGAYVSHFRDSLAWRSDIDDLSSEVEDHLRCAAQNLEKRGDDPASAQRAVLARFGDANVVAVAFATSSSGGIAMPTRFTHTSGTFAFISAAFWLVAVPLVLLVNTDTTADASPRYVALSLVLFVASGCTAVTLLGLLRRSGAGSGAFTTVVTGLAVLATAILGIVVWLWVIAVALLAIAATATVIRLRGTGVAVGRGGLLLSAAWPVGVAVALISEPLRLGPVDSYGDHYLGQLVGFSVGAILFAAGLAITGRWLRSEEIVDVPEASTTPLQA